MPSWNELLEELESKSDQEKPIWVNAQVRQSLQEIGKLRGGRNVLFYASAFLQKPQVAGQHLQITHEDINGFMSCIYGMDWSKGLTLLHVTSTSVSIRRAPSPDAKEGDRGARQAPLPLIASIVKDPNSNETTLVRATRSAEVKQPGTPFEARPRWSVSGLVPTPPA